MFVFQIKHKNIMKGAGPRFRRYKQMTNTFLLMGIILQTLLMIGFIWGILNEKKLIMFERRIISKLKEKKQRTKAAKRTEELKAAAKNLDSKVYYTPVKPVRKRSASSFDAA